jgi:hypothetical protein
MKDSRKASNQLHLEDTQYISPSGRNYSTLDHINKYPQLAFTMVSSKFLPAALLFALYSTTQAVSSLL